MQTDEDVGKVAAGSTYLVGKRTLTIIDRTNDHFEINNRSMIFTTFSAACALEAFLDTLLSGAIDVATGRSARTLTSAHL